MLKKKEKVEEQKVQNQEGKNKIGIKEKIKRFLKNKKAVGMLMECIITIECFAMLLLLVVPEEVKAASISEVDENGITWAYTLEGGKATNVYYESGTLGETVTIPARLSDGTNEYPVVSLYNSSGSFSNIFKNSGVNVYFSIKKVIIPEGVTNIGDSAFYNCSSLTSIEIPTSVKNIQYYAFNSCSSLKSVNIPERVASIDDRVFGSCSSLTSLTVDENNSNYSSENNILYDKNKTRLIKCAEGKKGTVIIPEGVRIIEDEAFQSCRSLTSVEIPSSVTIIESGAFESCRSLTSISIPYGVRFIGSCAFRGCNNLININIPEKVTTIGWQAFSGCSSLTSVEIPSSVTSIGDTVFLECSSLTSLTVNESNVNYSSENDILYNKDKTTLIQCAGGKTGEVIIPNSVRTIETEAFYRCSSLTNVVIPNSVTTIDIAAFQNCSSLTDIYIDNIKSNITFGGSWKYNTYAYVHYSDCKHNIIKNIEEGLQIEEISNNLQEGTIDCGETYLFKVLNGQGETVTNKKVKVTSQGEFTDSEEVTEEIKPNEDGIYTIENIERNKTIEIGFVNGETYQHTDENGITWEYKYEDGKARALKYISGEIPETLEVPAKIDGLVVTTMGDYPNYGEQRENIKNVILPDSIINIGQNAFENCTNLETIVLPEGLQLISYSAFKGCSNLRQVELPDDLLVIANYAFDGCTNLTMDLTFKEGLRAIGYNAFKDCSSLTGKLTLPETMGSIGAFAFQGCTGITSVEILEYTGEEELKESKVSFVSVWENKSIYSNEWHTSSYVNTYGTEKSYQGIYSSTSNVINNVKDENGNDVKDEFGNNVTESFKVTTVTRNVSIGGGAFNGCSSLTEIRLPSGTNKVAYSTIDGCDNLTDLYIAMKKEDMLEEVNTNGELNVHYLDCMHKVEVSTIEGTSIEVIAGEAGEGLAACEQDYRFKVNIEEGSTLKGVVVKVGNKGEEKEAIKADKNGIYCIENVTKDKEISIEEGRIVEITYEDKEGNQIAKSDILVGQEGENYKAERKEIENYRSYGKEPENVEGTFTQEEIVVTYKYEKIPSGTITIKYQDKEGNDIIDPETKQGYVGDEYEFARKNIKGYKAYGVTPENAKGTYTTEDIEIIFVYEEIKEEETVIKYIDKEGNYIARDKTVQEGEEITKEEQEKEIPGYENVEKTEEGKEITYTYEKIDKTGQTNKWTTEKTLMAIAGLIAMLIVIFIIIVKREKEVEMNGKKYRTIEEALETIKENKQEEKVEIKLLKDIKREEKIEGLEDETIKVDYNGYEIKIHEQENKTE